VDFQAFTARVHGKGEKDRPVYFGKVTKKALWRYVHEGADRPLETPLFLSDRGPAAGEALTRSGLFQLVRRIGKAAGIRGARCSPHTFRHTFAVDFLIGGGDAFSLQKLLGHSSQTMTQRYVQLARAQVAQQHRKFSPADQLRKR
jgi:integrase/recombinase XerC/integrase/recombinase XerD